MMNRNLTFFTLLLTLAAAPVALITGCSVFQGKESAEEHVDDKTITANVKTALYADPGVKANEVNVTTFKGVVQLSGFVEDQSQKQRAGEIARQTKGVVDVHNDLVVPTGR